MLLSEFVFGIKFFQIVRGRRRKWKNRSWRYKSGFHLDLQGIIISTQPPKCVALSIFDHDLEPYMEGQAFFKAAARLGSELGKTCDNPLKINKNGLIMEHTMYLCGRNAQKYFQTRIQCLGPVVSSDQDFSISVQASFMLSATLSCLAAGSRDGNVV